MCTKGCVRILALLPTPHQLLFQSPFFLRYSISHTRALLVVQLYNTDGDEIDKQRPSTQSEETESLLIVDRAGLSGSGSICHHPCST